jgi:mediator of RNA polymerase II transcription subunit 17, fungi type
MAENLALSLRAWPEPKSNSSSLSSLIQQINQQRGQFRDITEESLRAEIEADKEKPEKSQDLVAAGLSALEKNEDAPTRAEQIRTAREEIMKQIA